MLKGTGTAGTVDGGHGGEIGVQGTAFFEKGAEDDCDGVEGEFLLVCHFLEGLLLCFAWRVSWDVGGWGLMLLF